ncbi:MAG: biopolymer transporter ExbD [Myxococcota bacterium]|jgi:biopolymer transport protein ExbD/biopolymer transport protein TolR|nr:biopolymer transporter ExbD [Myxococcota bacterium]
MAMSPNSKGLRADINVTPLVDVILVLLIIFMVITPMLQRGKPVQLPETTQPEKRPDDGKDIVVSIEFLRKTGNEVEYRVYFGRELIDQETLRSRLQDELRKDSRRAVYVKGDKRLNYGVVREMMELCHEAGFTQVQLATNELKSKV